MIKYVPFVALDFLPWERDGFLFNYSQFTWLFNHSRVSFRRVLWRMIKSSVESSMRTSCLCRMDILRKTGCRSLKEG